MFEGEHLYLNEPLGKGIRIISRSSSYFTTFSVLGEPVVI